MARTAFSIKVDLAGVLALADRLGDVNPDKLGERLITTVNNVADSTYKLSRDTITTEVNLTDAYVRGRMELRPATKSKPVAEIVGRSGKGDYTTLSHYGAETGATKPVNWDNARIISEVFGGKERFRPWAGWARRTGDPRKGIEEGRKQYKMTAEVTRGSRKSIGKKFTLPGPKKVDSEGNPIVFKNIGPGGRDGKGSVERVLGPSVYQLFRTAATSIEDRVGNDLRDAVIEAAESAFEDALR